ncbi:hypothetical protein [Pandoraea sp. SD6-2]|uniref:hypothetical protein n=1 Tax=Pandoraea sp. SD6-2 TaxID=1286093 RepID=UPI00032FEB78|nr:hypothetical protein [Pandoraea sp. SD6-2]EON15327.1 hypothetical protein C266_02541 [Pandoraea sp. SD6-2]
MSIIVTHATASEVRELLSRAAKYDTTGGAWTVDDAMHGANLYAARDADGRMLFAWAMTVSAHRAGCEAFVTAAAGEYTGADLLAVMLPYVEYVARRKGATSLAFMTARRGMVKKTEALGFTVAATTMRKTL